VEESPHELLRKELHRASAVHPKAQPKKDTPADQLAKLSALNSEGIIDNAQYRAAKSKVMAELTKQRAATPNAKQARASMPAGVAVVKDEQQQQQEQDGKEARDGTAHISEETREAQVDAKATTKPAVKTEAQQEAAATADAKTLAADTAAKKKKSKVHKLMDQDDPNEARILDRYHEYTEDDDQQYNAPPVQQGGEKLDPQQKSFFTDVKREAYKVDAKKNFPEDMLGAMDLDVEPCDDFYEYACGSFLKDAVIPDYLTAYTLTWDKAKSQVISETSELLTNDPGEAGTFYRTCLDEDVVEEAGATPLTAWFQAIAGVTDMDSLSSFLATAGTYNWCGFLCWHVSINGANPDTNKMVISHVATTMPDQKYYVDEGEEMDKHREVLLGAMAGMLLAAGAPSESEAKRQAQVALQIESAVAKSMVSKERFRHIHAVKVSRDRIKELGPSVNWDIFFEGLGVPGVGEDEEDAGEGAADLYLHDFHYLENLEENVWSKFSFDDLRIYLIYRAVNVYTPYLSAAFSDAKMVLNDDLYGMSEKSPRTRKCYFLTVRQFKESIGKLFVDTYFPEVAEAAAQQMLGDIRIAFEDHLETLSWMDSDTRESAVEKLEGMDYQVGYPEGWPLLAKYGTLQLSEESFYQNIITVAQAHSQQERDRLFEEPMKEKWSHAATTTNAYYSRNKNALFIPAGILQPPFFSPDFPDCRNYGGIGSVLGHEMTHGFDDSGRKYDATGHATTGGTLRLKSTLTIAPRAW